MTAGAGGLLRLIARDVRDGLYAIAGRVLILLLGVNVLCYLLFTLVATGNTVVGGLSFADYVAACVGGINVYVPRGGDSFKLPAGWLCLCAGVAYVALDYPVRDLHGMGAQAMVAAGGRLSWWVAKCVWVVLVCLAAWVGILGVCAFWALAFGSGLGPGAFNLTFGVPALLGFDAPLAASSDMSPGFGLFIAAFPLVMAGICMMQTSLSVMIAPIVGFVATAAVLLVSALVLNPVLPGNYLMLARCDFISAAGLSVGWGFVVGLVLCLICAVIGALCSMRRDIYGREGDVL